MVRSALTLLDAGSLQPATPMAISTIATMPLNEILVDTIPMRRPFHRRVSPEPTLSFKA
jgi:hypothetical protein